MSGSVPAGRIGQYTMTVLGIAGSVVLCVQSDIPAQMHTMLAACLAGGMLLTIHDSTESNEEIGELAGLARMTLDEPDPPSDSGDIAVIREALMQASLRKQDLNQIRGTLSETKRLALLGQQAAGVAHELNNPLGGILMYANLIAEDMPHSDRNSTNLQKIIRETERCRSIVKRLLDIVRQHPPEMIAIRVNALLDEALGNIRPGIDDPEVLIHEEYGPSLPPVQADACQLQEVFENLLRNAVEALDGPGEVLIRTRHVTNGGDPGAVEITIADTGPGIAPDDLEHLFEPFYTTKCAGHGTGLGLAVSSSIIERHGGSITAANRAHGGASFTIRLPAGEAVS